MSLTAGKQLLLTSAAGSSAYQISRSLRFNAPDSSFLSRQPSSAGNRKTWTWAAWVKRSGLDSNSFLFTAGPRSSSGNPAGLTMLNFISNTLELSLYTPAASVVQLVTTQVFRDPSAWYHIVAVLDTDNATSTERLRLYVNGSRVTAFNTATYPAQGVEFSVNNTQAHEIGRYVWSEGNYLNAYLAECFFIDGQALDPSSFTTTDLTTGQLIPKAYTGNYGLVPVTAATGGLPIFNTTGTYGTVKDTGTRTDANSSSLVLALPMDGTNGGTSFGDQSAVIKGSGSAKTVTVSGATTSTALSKFYGSSGYFSSSTLSLASSADFAPGGDFTVEFWGNFSSVGPMFIVTTTGGLWIGQNGGNFVLRAYNNVDLVSYAGSPPLNAWTHIAVTRQSSTVRIFFNGIQVASAATSFVFQQSTLLIGTDGSTFSNGYMQDLRVYNGVAKYTSNFSPVSGPNNSFHLPFSDNSSTAALGTDTSGAGNSWSVNNFSVAQGNGSYIGSTSGSLYSGSWINAFNGVATPVFGGSGKPYNYDTTSTLTFSSALSGTIEVYGANGSIASTGGTAYIALSDGSQWSVASITSPNAQWYSFGSKTGITSISLFSNNISQGTWLGAIRVNGVVLVDGSFSSGNDSLVDTPTSYGTDTGVGGEVRGNYATLNLLDNDGNTLGNGNLELAGSGNTYRYSRSSIYASSGKWYWECLISATGGETRTGPQILRASDTLGAHTTGNIRGYINISDYAGTIYVSSNPNGSNTNLYTTSGSLPAGTIVGIALDATNGKLWISVNGTWLNSGNPDTDSNPVATGLTGPYTPGGWAYNSSDLLVYNFGQRSFSYTSNHTTFKALCDTNLPAPVVAKGSSAMDVALYTGTGAAQSITGLAFNPDFVWLKRRSSAQAHYLYDVIRGTSSVLYSDGTDAEQSISTGLTSFNSDGFSLGSLSGVNASSSTYVGWCWDAGTSTVTNTAGSISSQVRANPSAGFSVVTHTIPSSGGPWTVGHGLNVAPSLIISKSRSASGSWITYHASTGNTGYLLLNATDAFTTQSQTWNSTTPSSTVFTQGTAAWWGANYTYVSYCFSPVSGYSSFGSYTGNGSADGPFVYTGFRPRWIMIKNSSGALDWELVDTSRDPVNGVNNNRLQPNLSAAEAAGYPVFDILSNGFKVRNSAGNWNGSTNVLIYAAFAENPFQYARAR